MQGKENKFNRVQKIGIAMAFFSFILLISTPKQAEAANLGGPSHIGTFEGSTTFTTGSSNGVNPGLYLEVMDRYGNYKTYTSEDGVITVDGTKEGSYVTQAKLLGKTKYRDVHTGELLDQWEEGRDLELESSKMPVLTTTGKNLFPTSTTLRTNTELGDTGGFMYAGGLATEEYIPLTFFEQCVFSSKAAWLKIAFYDIDKKFISLNYAGNNKKLIFTPPSGAKFFRVSSGSGGNACTPNELQYQIEKGTIPTSYEPYKSNILTVNKPVELRGIGDVKDELDLLTGEVTERIGEYQVTGEENWQFLGSSRRLQIYYPTFIPNIKCGVFACDKLQAKQGNDGSLHGTDGTYYIGYTEDNWLRIILGEDLTSLEQGKEWLKANKPTIQYQLKTESIKTVVLTSDYYFQPVMNRDVHIDGTILPLVCSVTIPTEHLSFVLNPNEEKGKQFVAPDFSITNNTPASIYLELNTFEQLSNDLNDVLPTEHENWNTLDRKQSKDIALALVPKPSDGWLSLTEGPRYVADSSNYYLGEVKAESSVDFTFEANHGRAFLETLSPRYRLSFIFDFFDK